MTRAVRELLAALAKLNQAVPQVALSIMDDSLSPEKQIEFGGFLIEAGRLLQQHAHVVDSDRVDSCSRAVADDQSHREYTELCRS